MNAELTELVFILDRSGSMGGLESDTIGGFNGMIARQKKEGDKINVTTVLFDDEVEIVHDRFPIEIIEPLTDKEYFVRVLKSGNIADLKFVKYSNFCDISLHYDKRTHTVIVVSTIDNMVKGAAGQAIQNMNIMFGLEETKGLKMVGPSF